jgi:hypothetical protein
MCNLEAIAICICRLAHCPTGMIPGGPSSAASAACSACALDRSVQCVASTLYLRDLVRRITAAKRAPDGACGQSLRDPLFSSEGSWLTNSSEPYVWRCSCRPAAVLDGPSSMHIKQPTILRPRRAFSSCSKPGSWGSSAGIGPTSSFDGVLLASLPAAQSATPSSDRKSALLADILRTPPCRGRVSNRNVFTGAVGCRPLGLRSALCQPRNMLDAFAYASRRLSNIVSSISLNREVACRCWYGNIVSEYSCRWS